MKNDDNNMIVFLKGADRVRKRPAVIFGSDGTEGAVCAIKILLDIFLTEAALGYSKKLELTVKEDGSVCIRSHDRGFILDETIIDGKPAWYQDFCELYSGPRDPDDNYYFRLGSHHNDLYGKAESQTPRYQVDSDHCFDLCCVQYVSDFMHVEATRDGVKKILDFKKGRSVSELKKEPAAEPANTYFHFKIDTDVFDYTSTPFSELADFLRDAAITMPGLRCVASDEHDGTAYEFLYHGGAEDYVKKAYQISTPLFTKEAQATGKERYNYRQYDAKVKLVFAFANKAADVTTLHNYRRLEYGEHLDAVKNRLMQHINYEFAKELCRGAPLSFDDIKEHAVIILETNCTNHASMYITAAKKGIKNRMITDMSYDLLSSDFEHYIRQNRDKILSILKGVI